MRVLFLNPPFHPRYSREQRSPAVTKSGTLYYPKWLATAAGVAIKNGHQVDLVDAPASGATGKREARAVSTNFGGNSLEMRNSSRA